MRSDRAEAFWRFSLAFYARPGVAAALLALQDRDGGDVNLVLYALWLGLAGRRLAAGDLAVLAEDAAPAAAIVGELRALRRRLKADPAADIAALRRRILALEIAAERVVQARLAAFLPADAGDRLAAAAANLALCLGAAATTSAEADLLRRELAVISAAAPRPSA